jgi:EH_Signature domain
MSGWSLIAVPTVILPAWDDSVRAAWETRARGATALSRGAGTGRQFAELVEEARRLLLAGDLDQLSTRLSERRFVRAIVNAWLDDASLARATMSPQLVGSLAVRNALSRLTTVTIASLFFTHFDRLDMWHEGLFLSVRNLLQGAVAQQRRRAHPDLVEAIWHHQAYLLERGGPINLAGSLLASGDDVVTWLQANHLTGASDTRWGRLARDAFYLRRIEAAHAENGDHAFLETVTSEVIVRQRTESTEEDGLYFGHQVLAALTAKPTRHPSAAWLEATLAFAGDPRHSQTEAWIRWWSKVPAENLERAVRWMRGVDLRAFLDGVERYAHESRNESMIRMLDARKRLLLGLYEQDRVDDVRLILGDDIRRWIRRSVALTHSEEAQLRDPGKQDTAVIYVDCGDFCLVEGSHNFKLHIYLGGPPERLADRAVRSFKGTELRETFPYRHVQAHGPDSYLAVAHQGGEWIRTALDFLRRRGVVIEERGLMTSNEFADLARRRAAAWY